MSIFDLFNTNPSDKKVIRIQNEKIDDLNNLVGKLSDRVDLLETNLKETQLLLQYVTNAQHGMAVDMSTIYTSLQQVVKSLTADQDPFSRWGLGDDDDDDDGGGYLN
tara:strand:- start:2216 stop:2536 length:321 start_codon:yes stop_codon:yes gene_type:complete